MTGESNDNSDSERDVVAEIPRGNAAGFIKFLKSDLVSGFLVFLIALPLCLGIALACGYPAIAGIFTAVIGAILSTFISNSELTIKGPAAGLIVIAIGCVESFGGDGAIGGFTEVDMTAYRMALAVGVGAAILQILFGVFKGGILGEFFPLAAVHGMLAAIGVIIMVKQLPVALGVEGKGEPLEMIQEIPHYFSHMNPEIALIGGVGLTIMFLWPFVQQSFKFFKAVPSPLVVLLATVPMGMYFDLLHDHGYEFNGHHYEVGESFLVQMPDRIFGMFDYLTMPDFSAYSPAHLGNSVTWVMMFFVIGTLESILSAKAVDVIDPWKRKTDFDRDTMSVGVGNLACAMVGGLPMISEIVRSKANIDNGAKTRFANFWHGIFLLLCVALIPTVLHRIPLAALAAMLIYTGFRLTHPNEFVHTYRIGREQLVIFVATLIGVLATDLLIGIAIGIAVKMLIHVINGVPISSLFKPYLDITVVNENQVHVRAHKSAVFSNWILFRSKLVNVGINERRSILLDMSDTELVDHSVMEKLHELESDFADANLKLEIVGLEEHVHLSAHEFSARRRSMEKLERITIIIPEETVEEVCKHLVSIGVSGYTITPCQGVGRHQIFDARGGVPETATMNKVETIVPQTLAETVMDYCRNELAPAHPNSVSREKVDVLKKEDFRPANQPAVTCEETASPVA